jgi:hypothetical protein
MPTKKNPCAQPAPKPATTKSSRTKAGGAKAQRPSVLTAARPADAASSARRAAPSRVAGPADATPIASESLLTLITANCAALRKQLIAGGRKRAHAAAAKDDNNLIDALQRLEAGYRELLGR